MSAPRLVVMAGGSASGKSTLARLLQERMPDRLLLLQHDRYYRTLANPETADFDHPDALDTDLLVQNLDELMAGRPTALPVYDFPQHRRKEETETVAPRPILLVEGILTLAHGPLAQRADLRVFVHADADVRLARRLRRDLARRGRTLDSVLQRYLTQVRPGHLDFVEPSRGSAHLVLDGEGPVEDALASLEAAVRGLLQP